MENLNQLDTDLFLTLNRQHAGWLDPVMYYLSDREFWFPAYALLLGWLFWRFGGRRALGIALTIGVSVALADQVTSSLLKPVFQRLRPCHEPAIDQWVRVVWECGGTYGFASSHAANAFAFATVLTVLVGTPRPLMILLYVWAALVSYSRVYVGAHYPLDILAGAGLGTLAALLSAWGYRQIYRRMTGTSDGLQA
jgi:undecaprenyl-diphosphatase